MFGNINAIPFVSTMQRAAGLPAYIQRALAFLLGKIVEDAEYPNKIGDQDRAASSGEVFTGRAHAFDGVNQYVSFFVS